MTDSDSTAIECFEGFRWPLPVAFGAAVAACRFEQGDVLYRDPQAYQRLTGAIPCGLLGIQVLESPPSATGDVIRGGTDRRRSSWQSAVRIALVDLASGESEERILTQGKIFLAFWKGDEGWLRSDRSEPEFPRSGRELYARLLETTPAWSAHARRIGVRSGSQFILVVDQASDSSRMKAALVEDHLRSTGPVDRLDLTPVEAGVDDADRYHPTLVLRGFTLDGRPVDVAESELRACLYRGGLTDAADVADSGEATDRKEPGARFSAARHGLLVSI